MYFLNILERYFGKLPKKTISKQISNITITASEIKYLDWDVPLYHLSDKNYKLVDINHLNEFLKTTKTHKRVYVANNHDCDDFSFELMGEVSSWDSHLAFGIIWAVTPEGQAHAFNWCVGEDKEIWFIEPQNNKVFKPDNRWDIWWVCV